MHRNRSAFILTSMRSSFFGHNSTYIIHDPLPQKGLYREKPTSCPQVLSLMYS